MGAATYDFRILCVLGNFFKEIIQQFRVAIISSINTFYGTYGTHFNNAPAIHEAKYGYFDVTVKKLGAQFITEIPKPLN